MEATAGIQRRLHWFHHQSIFVRWRYSFGGRLVRVIAISFSSFPIGPGGLARIRQDSLRYGL